eukprot:6138763-Karenia_brevis.AAC.1
MNQHVSVRCAGRYFLVKHMSCHNGSIDKTRNESLLAMVVCTQSAPTHAAGHVFAATTVGAR